MSVQARDDGVAGGAVDVLRNRAAVEARISRWFPGTDAAHTIYQRLAAAGSEGETRVLHLGAGYDTLQVCSALGDSSVIAVDLDPGGLARHPSSMRAVGDGGSLPFRTGTFGLIACEHVFEHLEKPHEALAECARALRPGGRLVFLTPNRFSYVSLAASWTPHWFHVWYRSRMTGAASESDTFRTYFRLNTVARIRRLGRGAGLELDTVTTAVGWPTYLERAEWLHRFGVFFHWLLERGPAVFHISIIGSFVKKA